MCVKVLVFILQISVLCMGSLRPNYPEYEDYTELQGWLKIHEDLVDFRTAKTNCHSEGALVAGPWTAEFQTTISSLQTKKSSLSTLYSGAALRRGGDFSKETGPGTADNTHKFICEMSSIKINVDFVD